MAKRVQDTVEFRRFFANVTKLADRRALGKRIEKSPAGRELINKVIGEAKAGRGPNGRRYADYSKAYRKLKARTGGVKGRWLRGKDKTGRAGGMLDPKNFDYEVTSDGRLFLVWTPDPSVPEMAVYSRVHNDGTLTAGRNRDTTIPQRKWMHLDGPAQVKAVMAMFDALYKQLVADINAGRTI